jgi:hypothetical protein
MVDSCQRSPNNVSIFHGFLPLPVLTHLDRMDANEEVEKERWLTQFGGFRVKRIEGVKHPYEV